tara:strand:+ start:1367 stop:1657 length:291 start_codon:yes stop_codon:yes gene_type:complete
MITPTTTVQLYDFHGELQQVKLITLMLWAVALRSEVKGVQVSPTPAEPIVRKFLDVPEDYDLELISEYITGAHEDIKEQLGIESTDAVAPSPPSDL